MTTERMNDNDRTNDRTNEETSEGTNEWTSEGELCGWAHGEEDIGQPVPEVPLAPKNHGGLRSVRSIIGAILIGVVCPRFTLAPTNVSRFYPISAHKTKNLVASGNRDWLGIRVNFLILR